MPITKAVASSVKTPGFYLVVNLLGAALNPGSSALRTLLIAPKAGSGTISADTEVRTCYGPVDVQTALGSGSLGHLAAKAFYKRHPTGRLDVVAPVESTGVAATATITFTGPATENSAVRFRQAGRTIDVPWASGESAATFVARAVATINQQTSDLPAVAADAGSGSITLTAKVKGVWGNDVRIWQGVITGGAGIAISANPTALTGGTLEPNLTNVLALVGTTEYGRIIPCLSNADATDTSSSSNAERVSNHLNAHEEGAGSLLQVAVIGHTGSVANVKAGAIDRNNEAIAYVFGRAFDDLPAELAAGEAGDALQQIERSGRPNVNRIGTEHAFFGPRDVVAQKLTPAEKEDLLASGVSPLDVDDASGVVFLVAPVTTHSTSAGAPDFRAYHLGDTDSMFAVCRDLRTVVPQTFRGASISEDLAAGADPLPAGVVEVRDVRAFIISRLRFWVGQGVVKGPALDAAIESGELIVAIDETDASQVNVFIPLSIIKPLAKFGVVASKVA